MQVEQPHHAPASAGECLRQYAMIVLSILTALTLEYGVVSLQNRSDAAESKARIEAELAANARDLKDALATNQQNTKQATALLHALVEHLKAGKPIDAEIEALLKPGLAIFSVSVPSFQHSAWDSAIADHSAAHLAPGDLHKYAEIYTAAADAQSAWQLLLSGEWLSRAAELNIDYRLGKVDQRNFANVLVRFLLAAQQIGTSEETLLGLVGGPHAS